MMCIITVLWALVELQPGLRHRQRLHRRLPQRLPARRRPRARIRTTRATIPAQTYMIYQLMFAIITPALICGAFAERMKFSAMCLFLTLWALVVYSPMAHMVWGKGGLLNASLNGKIPCLDFAGGTVVHVTSGCFGADLRALSRQTRRLSERTVPAALRGAELHRRLHAVGGLVRIQRRQRGQCQRPGHQRLRQYPLRHSGRGDRLERRGVDSQRQAQRPRRDFRRGRRTGRHHPGFGFRAADVGAGDRPGRRQSSAS